MDLVHCLTCPVLYLFVVLLGTVYVGKLECERLGSRCRFPEDWKGRYFQSGLGEIFIRDSHITTKGTCVEQSRDYFMLSNRKEHCFHCLLLRRQHSNIIQYKESYCTGISDMKVACAQIKAETPLYTIVRDPAIPVACPFRDSYLFAYNDEAFGTCDKQLSSASPCSDFSKFLLTFRHCQSKSGHSGYSGREMDLNCLASWKDGSDNYLYAYLNGSGFVSNDDRFRCFKYEFYGNNGFSLSMSADATCRGLSSASGGPLMLEFSKDNSNVSTTFCRFPDWLQAVTWRDLTGSYYYHVNDKADTIISKNVAGNQTHLFRCKHIYKRENSRSRSEEYTIHVLYVHNCASKHRCAKFRRISDNVLEIETGEFNRLCRNEAFTDKIVLIPEPLPVSFCPRFGVHHTQPSGGCLHRLTFGCRNESQIGIDHSCSAGHPGITLECLITWQQFETSYVIVRHLNSHLLYCYSFRQEGGVVQFGLDRTCHTERELGNKDKKQEPIKVYNISRYENCRKEMKMAAHEMVHKWSTTMPTTTTIQTTTTTTSVVHDNRHHNDVVEKIRIESSDDYDDPGEVEGSGNEGEEQSTDVFSSETKPVEGTDTKTFHVKNSRIQGRDSSKPINRPKSKLGSKSDSKSTSVSVSISELEPNTDWDLSNNSSKSGDTDLMFSNFRIASDLKKTDIRYPVSDNRNNNYRIEQKFLRTDSNPTGTDSNPIRSIGSNDSLVTGSMLLLLLSSAISVSLFSSRFPV